MQEFINFTALGAKMFCTLTGCYSTALAALPHAQYYSKVEGYPITMAEGKLLQGTRMQLSLAQ